MLDVHPQTMVSPSTTTAISLLSSFEAERATLGALLADPDRVVDVLSLLAADDFAYATYRAVYAVLRRMTEERRPIDLVTVSSELAGDTRFQADGGSALLAELCAEAPIAANAVQYAEIVRDRALHRRLADVGRSLIALAEDATTPAQEIVERAEQKILALGRQSVTGRPSHVADVAAESYERYVQLHEAEDNASLFGLRTGFRSLDQMLTGLAPGQLVILAARPSMGKTALALDIARHVASAQQKNVALFSLEMSKQEIMDRVVAGFLGVEAWKLKKGELSSEDFARMGKLFDGLREHPLFIDDDPDATIANLRSKARRHQLEHGLDLLVVDYLQLIETTDRAAGENRTQQVSHISRSLKTLARELGCPVLALSQLSRSVEQRSPAIPILSDLRESGSIEQDADVVLMLYRESAYHEDCDDPAAADLFVRKNRSGPTGRVALRFVKERMSFVGELPE